MDLNSILPSIITGIVTLLVCMITNGINNKKTIALIEYKLDELTKHVEKHNQVVERTYQLEKDVAILKDKIDS